MPFSATKRAVLLVRCWACGREIFSIVAARGRSYDECERGLINCILIGPKSMELNKVNQNLAKKEKDKKVSEAAMRLKNPVSGQMISQATKPDIYRYLDYRRYLTDFYNYRKSVNPNFSYQSKYCYCSKN